MKKHIDNDHCYNKNIQFRSLTQSFKGSVNFHHGGEYVGMQAEVVKLSPIYFRKTQIAACHTE